MSRKTARTAYYGVMTALALLLSYLESLVPLPVPVPGVKLGLANLAVLFLLYQAGPVPALVLSLCRVLLASLLFSGFSGLLFSLAGALLSWCVMALLVRSEKLTGVGVSLAGGLAHNLGQLATAALVTASPGILAAYLPVLIVAGAALGAVNGGIFVAVRRALEANPALRAWLRRIREE